MDWIALVAVGVMVILAGWQARICIIQHNEGVELRRKLSQNPNPIVCCYNCSNKFVLNFVLKDASERLCPSCRNSRDRASDALIGGGVVTNQFGLRTSQALLDKLQAAAKLSAEVDRSMMESKARMEPPPEEPKRGLWERELDL